VESLCGDASRAKELIGWDPQVFAPQLAEIMVDADIKRASFLY
jgi:GDPmannose 4,6-dehydratase